MAASICWVISPPVLRNRRFGGLKVWRNICHTKNNYQEAIDAAKTGTYKLSTIFGNTYSMSDYVTRAYRWGYMAVRFMNEKTSQRYRCDGGEVPCW